MKLYVGIDGGQSATKSIIADETGRVLGRGLAGPCRHLNDEQTRQHVRQVLFQTFHAVLSQAGASDSQEIESAYVGLTGVAGPEVPAAKAYQEVILERFKIRILHIDHDALSALAGAIPSMIGVVTIAGTGSIAFGMNERGVSARAGGWGYLLGDEGSAYEIGRQALIAIAREHDGLGPATGLTPLVLASLGIDSAARIPQVIYSDPAPKLRISDISLLAFQAAQQEDAVALGLFSWSGQQLALMACTVVRRLGLQSQPVAVSGTGGVFQAGVLIWQPYRETVLNQCPLAAVKPPRFEPLIGSLVLAWKYAGITVRPEWLERLENESV